MGYWGFRDAPEIVKLMLLAFTAGVLTTVAVLLRAEDQILHRGRRKLGRRSPGTLPLEGDELFEPWKRY